MKPYSSFSELWWETMPIQILLGPNLDIRESIRLISENPIVDETFVRAHPDICWDTEGLFRNPSFNLEIQISKIESGIYFPIEYIRQHLNTPWNFLEFSRNPYLTWDHIYAFPEAPWDVEALLKNPMTGWKDMWESQQRIQARTKKIHNELVTVTGQTGYYFRCCKSKKELIEEDELAEDDLEQFRLQYPVNFRL